MASSTPVTLLKQLRDGANALAWDEFFGRYWPMIYGFARHFGCSEHSGEEIVQEVMLVVFERRDVYQYDPTRGRFRDWLGAIVRNRLAERHRRRSDRIRAVGGEGNNPILELPADEHDAAAAWEAAFESSLLLTLLDVVRRENSARVYLAFELVALQGLSPGEAAQLIGLSRNAVYKAGRRVRRRLVQLGAPYRDEGRLTAEIKQALDRRPLPAVVRCVTARVRQTMHQRRGL
jgi:RNA polymerase sigma-70 factor (ECF subfamily)